MTARRIAVGTVIVSAALGISAAAPLADERPEIRFHRGAIDATIEGTVVRGDRDIYPVSAGAGQVMTVEIASLEDNAVFQIYPPSTHYSRNMGEVWTFHGRPLRGADGDTRRWSGSLVGTGQYLIVVGGTRGNATYDLNVRIE